MDNFKEKLQQICEDILRETDASSISHLYNADVVSAADEVATVVELQGDDIDENVILDVIRDLGYSGDKSFENDVLEASMKLLNVDWEGSVEEGYTTRELTDYDREMLSRKIPGLEGPWRNRADGRYYYYDPREGRYYDPSTDFYMDREFQIESIEESGYGYAQRQFDRITNRVEELVDAGRSEDEIAQELDSVFGAHASKYLPQILRKMQQLDEVAPEGWEGTVKAMKKHNDIDNPWALAWHMKNKGYKSHKKEGVEEDRDYYIRETLKRIQMLSGIKK